MKIDKIYFDMDGVLANFDKGVKDLCGISPNDVNDYDKKSDDLQWDSIRKVSHFYAKLEPVPSVVSLFNKLREKGYSVEILTGIPKKKRKIENAEKDKREWVKKYLGSDVVVNVVYREQKKDYCNSRRDVLIDDMNLNITDWRKFGGSGILFTDAKSVLREIEKLENSDLVVSGF